MMNALIVIYNKSLADSITIESMRLPHNTRVLIADNSTSDYGNRAFAEAHGYTYVDMGGNMGLSKAYNRALSMLDNTDGFICLFDDDTEVDSWYFEALTAAAAAHPEVDLFAPVVVDAKGILSPCAIRGIACRRMKSLKELPEHGVSAINSGLAIRLKVFRDYRFDEGQFLDYIDHAFIRDITGHERSRIFVMEDVTLRQRFSGSEKQSGKVAMERYRIFKKDIGYFCRKYRVPYHNKVWILLKRRMNILIQGLSSWGPS